MTNDADPFIKHLAQELEYAERRKAASEREYREAAKNIDIAEAQVQHIKKTINVYLSTLEKEM